MGKRLFARLPLAQRAIRSSPTRCTEFMVYVAVVHRRTFRGRFNIAASDLAKDVPVRHDPRQGSAAQAHPDYDFCASGRRSPTATTSPSTSPRCTYRTAASTGSNRTASSPTTVQGRHRHPRAGNGIRSVGGQLPGHRGRRPRRPQPRKVVAGNAIPGLTRVSPYRTSPTSSAWPALRLHRLELLQHDGVPDAAWIGCSVRSSAAGEHLRGHRGGQHRYLDRMTGVARRFNIHPRQLRFGPVVLFQPRGEATCCDRCRCGPRCERRPSTLATTTSVEPEGRRCLQRRLIQIAGLGWRPPGCRTPPGTVRVGHRLGVPRQHAAAHTTSTAPSRPRSGGSDRAEDPASWRWPACWLRRVPGDQRRPQPLTAQVTNPERFTSASDLRLP